jgi:hypothetical protein
MRTISTIGAGLCLILLLGLTSSCGGEKEPVTVVFNWVYFVSEYSCKEPPSCANPICESSSGCNCVVCADPPHCVPNTLTLYCCTQTAKIKESDSGQLASDYPACDLSQTTSTTYALECNWDDGAPAYTESGSVTVGTPFKYTNDTDCTWDLPYTVP